MHTCSCIVNNNRLINNSNGIHIVSSASHSNIIVGNEIINSTGRSSETGAGIFLIASSNNTIRENVIIMSDWVGIVTWGSDTNLIHHNNLNNEWQVMTDFSQNFWDNGCEGNFWSDYNGTDLDGNGIGDTPYVIDESNTDHYPLMNLYWHPADINKDLKVDIYDAVLVGASYYATPSDPHWNCHCDIVEPYGIIDVFDVVLMADSYGEEYSP